MIQLTKERSRSSWGHVALRIRPLAERIGWVREVVAIGRYDFAGLLILDHVPRLMEKPVLPAAPSERVDRVVVRDRDPDQQLVAVRQTLAEREVVDPCSIRVVRLPFR